MWVMNGERHFGCELEGFAFGYADPESRAFHPGVLQRKAAHVGVTLPPLDDVATEPVAMARVHNNMWIVDCPWCSNAEFAFLNTPLFMCENCWNQTVGGKWIAVKFPPDVKEIDAALEARPVPNNRNWNLGESVSDLETENVEHGLPERA